MADFDVQPIAVSSPPQPAYVTSYRPAVSVRNNGVHEAYASGLFRIYTAGKLIFTTSILSGLIQPKQTKEALGLEYWTPPAAGTYLVLAYATTDQDQVVSNDNLAPVTLVVAGTPPPPPPGVTAHAAQHEENAADEIDLDGLRGKLADPQDAAAHKASHMAGGSDLINVDGLAGTLLDGQPIRDHHTEHEDGGGDELNVDELSGVLKNLQKPKIHANEAHDPNYVTDSDLTTHKTAVTAHENRRNVAGGFCGLGTNALVPTGNLAPEPVVQAAHFLKVDQTWTQAQELAAKGQANGYAGLGANGLVPITQLAPIGLPPPADYVLRSDQSWGLGASGPHKASHEDGGADEISIAGLSGKAADAQTPTTHKTSHENGGTDVVRGWSKTADRVQFSNISGEVTLIEGTIPFDALGTNLHIMAGVILDTYTAAAAATWRFRLYVAGVSCVQADYAMPLLARTWQAIIEGHLIQTTATHFRPSISLIGENSANEAIIRTGYNINAIAWPGALFPVKLTCEIISLVVNQTESLAAYIGIPSGLQKP